MRIVWRDKNRNDDPNPYLNGLEHYINRSKVDGISEAYTLAIDEYINEYNYKCEEIARLKQEINVLKSKLNVWESQQHGRSSVLNDINKKIIDKEKFKGTSNRKIAKKLNISEATVRNYLKSTL